MTKWWLVFNKWIIMENLNFKFKGQDGVVACIYSGTVQQMYNSVPTTPSLLVAANPSVDIVNATVLFGNNWLSCTFSRIVADSSVTNYYNLSGSSNQYYILAATGQYSGGTLTQHTTTATSSTLIDFTKVSTSASSSSTRKTKAHGKIKIIKE